MAEILVILVVIVRLHCSNFCVLSCKSYHVHNIEMFGNFSEVRIPTQKDPGERDLIFYMSHFLSVGCTVKIAPIQPFVGPAWRIVWCIGFPSEGSKNGCHI